MTTPFTTPIPAKDLREGDFVDLEGDLFADVPTDERADLGSPFQYEYSVVLDVHPFADDAVMVEFDDVTVGFPAGHLLPVNTELSSARRAT